MEPFLRQLQTIPEVAELIRRVEDGGCPAAVSGLQPVQRACVGAAVAAACREGTKAFISLLVNVSAVCQGQAAKGMRKKSSAVYFRLLMASAVRSAPEWPFFSRFISISSSAGVTQLFPSPISQYCAATQQSRALRPCRRFLSVRDTQAFQAMLFSSAIEHYSALSQIDVNMISVLFLHLY